MSFRTFQQTSVIEAPADDVWQRVTDFEGINAELMPVMRMRVPRAHRGTTVATVPVGVPLGRAWIFYFGLLPLDYDNLMLTELEPGSHFQEVSTMLSMRRWEHRRQLRVIDTAQTEVTDTVGFEPRLPLWLASARECFGGYSSTGTAASRRSSPTDDPRRLLRAISTSSASWWSRARRRHHDSQPRQPGGTAVMSVARLVRTRHDARRRSAIAAARTRVREGGVVDVDQSNGVRRGIRPDPTPELL